MLNGCINLNLFPFGQICTNQRALGRALLSMIIINGLPIIVFAKMLVFLDNDIVTAPPNALNVIGIFLMSMIVFAVYRGFQAIIVWKPHSFFEDWEICRIFHPSLKHQSWGGHFCGMVLYALLSVLGYVLAR